MNTAANTSVNTAVQRRTGGDLTAEFWDAAATGRLVRPVCGSCGRSFFTPRVVCPHCRSSGWCYAESDGRGVVSSHTTVHRGPDPTWVTPYVLGVVDMDEGWNLLTRLLVEPPDESDPGALIGTRVHVEFIDDDHSNRTLPAFAPDAAAAATDAAVAATHQEIPS